MKTFFILNLCAGTKLLYRVHENHVLLISYKIARNMANYLAHEAVGQVG